MVTRLESVARAQLWPIGAVSYAQWGTASPTGHRPDCAGYVSMCWGLPAPGENTVTLVTRSWMREIPRGELLPGDAVGLCGPGTAGDTGHIQMVESYDAATGHVVIWEQTPPAGPRRRELKSIPAGYRPYRLNTMEEDMPLTDDDLDRLVARLVPELVATLPPAVWDLVRHDEAAGYPNPYGYNQSNVLHGANLAAWKAFDQTTAILAELAALPGRDAAAIADAVVDEEAHRLGGGV